eukprot:6201649-Pleurochrysis_carterae.AAC.2
MKFCSTPAAKQPLSAPMRAICCLRAPVESASGKAASMAPKSGSGTPADGSKKAAVQPKRAETVAERAAALTPSGARSTSAHAHAAHTRRAAGEAAAAEADKRPLIAWPLSAAASASDSALNSATTAQLLLHNDPSFLLPAHAHAPSRARSALAA